MPTLMPVARRVLEAAEIGPREAVLDVGTRTGLAAVLAAERVGPTGTVVGFDRSPELLAVARERATVAGYPQIRWLEGDAERTEFAEESFDVALSLFDFPTHRRPHEVLDELHRVLAPDARLVIAVWGNTAANAWYSVLRRALAQAAPRWPWREPSAFLLSRPGALEVLVQASGFADVDSLRIPDRMRLPDTAAVWEWIAGLPDVAAALAQLEAPRLAALRQAVTTFAAEHLGRDGEVVLRREVVYLRAFKRER